VKNTTQKQKIIFSEGNMKRKLFTEISLSGGYREKGTGTLQLTALCCYLRQQGFRYVDFGMMMDYKKAMGARDVKREDWLKLNAQLTAPPLPFDLARTSASVVIKGAIHPTPHSTQKTNTIIS
jgi:hypothetical protein